MVVLYVLRDSERDAGEWMGQKWQFQRDVIIEQPLNCYIITVCTTQFFLHGSGL